MVTAAAICARWVEAQLGAAGIALAAPKIPVLCYPRIFGYVFNPLTVCSADEGDDARRSSTRCTNTFRERRTYVIRVATATGTVEQSCAKELYVSPFVPMDCAYHFHIEPPGESVLVAIDETDPEGLLLRGELCRQAQAADRRDAVACPARAIR